MPFVTLDSFARKSVLSVQDYAILSGRAISNVFRHPRYVNDIFTQADIIGVGSLPIVILTGFFTGAVLALQSSSLAGNVWRHCPDRHSGVPLDDQGAGASIDPSLMISGRNASGMASELGSMVVTEQIDAMRALGTDPMKKLVVPRMVATVVMQLLPHHHFGRAGHIGGCLRRRRTCWAKVARNTSIPHTSP